jgi:hypothetical protein
MKAPLLASIALSLVFSGSMMPAAWAKILPTEDTYLGTLSTMLDDCDVPNPNIRYFRAPACKSKQVHNLQIETICPGNMYCYPLLHKEIIYPQGSQIQIDNDGITIQIIKGRRRY